MTPVKIILDHRELKSLTAKHLYELDINIETAQLAVGDYILSDQVCAERKCVNDFVVSLMDGRLFNQAVELKRNFQKPLLILEGDVEELFEKNVSQNAIWAAMASLTLDYQIPILFSRDPEDTAKILAVIARREQEERNREVSLRGSKRTQSLAEQQQYFVEGISTIGPSLAKSLLRHFKTPSAILSATEDQLQEVNKLGKKKSEIIKKLINSEYTE